MCKQVHVYIDTQEIIVEIYSIYVYMPEYFSEEPWKNIGVDY